MRTSLHKFAAVSAVALSAGFFAMQADAQSADPGSRPGDVRGTIQPIPQTTGGSAQCQAIFDMADRQAGGFRLGL